MVAARKYIDNAPTTTLAGSITSSDTSITVASLAGFPTSFPYYATLDIGSASAEVIQVTAATGPTATIVRNVNGLGAFAHTGTSGTFTHTAVALDFQEANDHHVATSGVHGVAGAIVGTTDAQTLSAKTLASPVVTGVPSGPGWVPVGGMLPYAGFTPPSGWAICDGSAVSRSTYAALFAAASFTQTCTVSAGLQNITVADKSVIAAGFAVEGPGIPSGTTVLGQSTGSTVDLSVNATSSGTVTLRFLPYGAGDHSTTFNLPDYRVRAPFGAQGGTSNILNSYTAGGTGDGNHSHPLSSNGQAQVNTNSSPASIQMHRVSTASWDSNASQVTSGAGSNQTGTLLGAALAGATDTAVAYPPRLSTHFIIRLT